MAQAYPGSNNIPLLFRDGAFGSRLTNNDAASPRYIFTKLESLTRLIYKEEDDSILNYLEDDGDRIEPEYYFPIIPMVLVNGCSGIGTAWSTNIPQYNPEDVVTCVKQWLDKKEIPDIKPWYRGFLGTIEKIGDNKFVSYGVVNIEKGKKVVTEIPMGKGCWIEKYKEDFETLERNKLIKKFDNYSTPNKPHFVITENGELNCNVDTLSLKASISTTNMVLFTESGKLKKYGTIKEIIEDFCEYRYTAYIKRKKCMLDAYRVKLKWLNNKKRFLEEVMDKKLVIEKRDENEIVVEMESVGYDKKDDGYNYLLNLPVKTFSKQVLDKLFNDIDQLEKTIKKLQSVTEKQLWLDDLNDFLEKYKKWLLVIEKE